MFIAYVDQTKYGCDYTIACGKVLWKLKASSLQEAKAEIRVLMAHEYEDNPNDLMDFDSITLFEVKQEIPLPLEDWYISAEEKEKSRKDIIKQTQEREVLARLKAWYEL